MEQTHAASQHPQVLSSNRNMLGGAIAPLSDTPEVQMALNRVRNLANGLDVMAGQLRDRFEQVLGSSSSDNIGTTGKSPSFATPLANQIDYVADMLQGVMHQLEDVRNRAQV